MQRALVMTVMGQDRPGLVESVADEVAKHSGNWLESRMSRLGGQFAGILRVELPAENEKGLVAALKELDARGLSVVVSPDTAAPTSQAPAKLRLLEIVGHDRPGIVRQISRALAANGVNVEELETECSSAAMTGEVLFKARARLSIPPNCNLVALRQELEKIAADLIVDLAFEELVDKTSVA
jgi:glycine cleavage system regulatory protein